MGTVLLAIRLLLAGVFALAAAAKLADRPGTRFTVERFGVPARLAGPLALIIPTAELIVAAALVPAETARWGAVGAVGLLAVFSAAVGLALRRGEAVDCNCFGQLSPQPIGLATLGRNAVLGAGATLVVVEGAGPGILGWLAATSAADRLTLALVVVALAAASLAAGLVRAHGRLLLRVEELEDALGGAHAPAFAGPTADVLAPGDEAPALALPSLDGDEVTLDGLLGDARPALLVFSAPGCGPCHALLPEVAEWQATHADAVSVVLVGAGSAEEHRDLAAEHGLTRVLVDPNRAQSDAWGVRGTPSAILVAPDGTVAAPPAVGAEDIRRLVATASTRPAVDVVQVAAGNGSAPAA